MVEFPQFLFHPYLRVVILPRLHMLFNYLLNQSGESMLKELYCNKPGTQNICWTDSVDNKRHSTLLQFLSHNLTTIKSFSLVCSLGKGKKTSFNRSTLYVLTFFCHSLWSCFYKEINSICRWLSEWPWSMNGGKALFPSGNAFSQAVVIKKV